MNLARTPVRKVPPVVSGELGLVLGVLLAPPLAAQDSQECLFCHEDPDMTGTRDGREISVHVDPEVFSGSVHGDWDCVSCHVDLEGIDMHADDVERVDCGMWHDTEVETLENSRHGRFRATNERWAPGCADCHG
ncbi:MAG: hypothetical protein ACE5GX_14930, partial [Thermoanaerobaculia bacterium]